MRLLLAVVSLLAVATAQNAAQNVAKNASAGEEEALFDGASLAGWRGEPDYWRVEAGCLVGSSVGHKLPHNTFLVRDGAPLRDFEFVVQVQVEGDNNSGIQYRSRELPDQPFRIAGPQCDLNGAGPGDMAKMYDERGVGIVARHGELVRFGDDERPVLGALPTLGRVDLRQWHQVRIVAMGELVWHEVDDVPVTAWLDRRQEGRQPGLLALQLHGGKPMTVRFRSPRLRRFADAAAMATAVPVPPVVRSLLDAAKSQPAADASSGVTAQAVAQWIWLDATKDATECFARRTFKVGGPALRGEIVVSADDHCRVYLNGERIAVVDGWETPRRFDITKALRRGDNVVAVHAWNDGGPAAFALALTGQHQGGRIEVVSDGSWAAGADDPDGWNLPGASDVGFVSATVLGEVGQAGLPWSGRVGRDAFGPPRDPLLPQVAVVAPGITCPIPAKDAPPVAAEPPQFRSGWPEPVLQLLAVPKALGTWVSLAADDQGRLYAGAQDGGLFRITPATALGGSTTIERVPGESFGAHGLLWFRNALYVVQNERDPGLYRLTDRDGDGMPEHRELLQALVGKGEHGPHSVVVARGGRLLVVAGNHTKLPKLARSRVPLNFAEDRLLPRLDDPHPYWEGHSPPGGWVCTCDPDGKDWELIACGFRNPYDAVVLPEGEVIVYDADMEWDLGLPWYRPTRELYVISGADYGWRLGSAKWPTDYPEAPPALHELGAASPTGMAMRREELGSLAITYSLDWTFGVVYREGQPWLQGAPLPLCDIAIDGGTIYMVTGGRGLPSQLLRVGAWSSSRNGGVIDDFSEHPELTIDPPSGSWPDFEAAARRESPPWTGWPLVNIVAARAALEAVPVAEWRASALAVDPKNPLRSLHGLLALARQGAPSDLAPILDALGQVPFAALEHRDRIAWLRVHALALLRLGPVDATLRSAIAARLLPLFPTGNERQDQDLAELLAFVDADGLVKKAVPLLAELRPAPVPAWAQIADRNDVYGRSYAGPIAAMAAAMPPIGQLALADALRHVRSGWTLADRTTWLRFMQQARQQKGGNSYDGFIKRMIDAFWQHCSDDERRELAALYAAAKADRPKVVSTPPVGPGQDWQVTDIEAVLQPGLGSADSKRGRNLFHATSCASCHAFAGEGGGRGPDLTSLGTRFSARDVLESVLAPSAVVSDQYTGQILTLKDGRTRFGAVSKGWFGDVEVYELIPAEAGALIERFAIAEVASVTKSPLSPMPADLVDRLSAAELRDLVAFLLSRGAR